MNLNKVLIAGRLTADPQLKTTPTGRQVGTFSVATNRVWNSPDGRRQEAVEYHNVVVWDRQADIVSRFLTKGSLILVEGRLQTRSWDDKQGQKRRTTEIIAERIQLGPRPQTGGAPYQPKTNFSPAASAEPAADLHAFTEVPTVNLDEPMPPAEQQTEQQTEIKPEDLPF